MISNSTFLLPQIRCGRVRALAITGPTRSQLLPDVPTIAEAGLPKVQMVTWSAAVGPKGMPPPVVQKLNATINAVLTDPKIVRKCDEIGCQVEPQTVGQFAELIRGETAHWGEVVKRAKVSTD